MGLFVLLYAGAMVGVAMLLAYFLSNVVRWEDGEAPAKGGEKEKSRILPFRELPQENRERKTYPA